MDPRQSGPRALVSQARVQDWILSVLNPLVGALERALGQLPRGPGRWDFRTRAFATLHPLAEYVDAEYQPNLQDLVEKHPQFTEQFERHDVLVQRLRTATEVAHARLVAFDEGAPFRAAVQEAMAMRPSEDAYRTLAGYVVSGYDEVPRDFPLSAVYNPGMQLAVRGRGCIGDELELQAKASSELATYCGSLLAQLRALRTELADRFGVRIVPFTK